VDIINNLSGLLGAGVELGSSYCPVISNPQYQWTDLIGVIAHYYFGAKLS